MGAPWQHALSLDQCSGFRSIQYVVREQGDLMAVFEMPAAR
jgi:hypothetical protein